MALEKKEFQPMIRRVRRLLAVMLIYFLIALTILLFGIVLAPLSILPGQSPSGVTPMAPTPTQTPMPTSQVLPAPPELAPGIKVASLFGQSGKRAFPPPPDRQRMLADLSRLFGSIPFLSVALDALAEFTPVLLAVYLLRGVTRPEIRRLLNLSQFLILVHFTIYFLPAMNRLLASRWFMQWDEAIWMNLAQIAGGDFMPFDLGFVFGGRYLGVAVLGILLPFMIRQWIHRFRQPVGAKAAPQRKASLRRNPVESRQPGVEAGSAARVSRVDIAFILLVGLCIAFPVYAIASSGWSLSACGEDFRDLLVLTQSVACLAPVWPMAILLAGGLLAPLLFWLLRLGMGLLGLKIPSAWLWISVLLMLAVHVGRLPALWNYGSDPMAYMQEGRLWFVLAVLLGIGLTLSLARALYSGLQALMGWKKDPSPQAIWLVAAVLIVFSVPTLGLVYEDKPLGRLSDIYQLAYRLDNFLIFIWVAAVGYILYLDGKSDLHLEDSSRKLALLAMGVFLFRLTPQFMYVPVAFLVGYLILRWATDPPELLKQPGRTADELREWIRTFSLVRLSDQLYGGIRRENTKKLAKGESTLAVFLTNMSDYENTKKEQEKLLPTRQDGSRIDPLAFGPYRTAWANGRHGLSWSLIFAMPWIVIYIFSFLAETEFNATFPLLSFVEDIIILVGLWATLGFVMGYFFPYLRGSSGLQKGLVLGLVWIVARMPLSFAYYRDFGDWQALILLSMQIFIHCLLLGLLAFDFYLLNKWQFSFQQLLEIHGLSAIGIWVSSLVLALTAVITTLLSSEVQAGGLLNLGVSVAGKILGVDLSNVNFAP